MSAYRSVTTFSTPSRAAPARRTGRAASPGRPAAPARPREGRTPTSRPVSRGVSRPGHWAVDQDLAMAMPRKIPTISPMAPAAIIPTVPAWAAACVAVIPACAAACVASAPACVAAWTACAFSSALTRSATQWTLASHIIPPKLTTGLDDLGRAWIRRRLGRIKTALRVASAGRAGRCRLRGARFRPGLSSPIGKRSPAAQARRSRTGGRCRHLAACSGVPPARR